MTDTYCLCLSIQTCPPVAGTAFAETQLQLCTVNNLKIVHQGFTCTELGYSRDSVLKHAHPEDLFAHIETIRTNLDAALVMTLLQRLQYCNIV